MCLLVDLDLSCLSPPVSVVSAVSAQPLYLGCWPFQSSARGEETRFSVKKELFFFLFPECSELNFNTSANLTDRVIDEALVALNTSHSKLVSGVGDCTMVENGKKHRQNSHIMIHFPTSERCERTSERTIEGPSTAVCIFGCYRPYCIK